MEKVSNHPPLRERIARLQALTGTTPVAIPPAPPKLPGWSGDQLQAKFSESALFVRNLASTDPEVLAKTMQAALLASPLGRRFLQGNERRNSDSPRLDDARSALSKKLYEANLASTGDLERSRERNSRKALTANPTQSLGEDFPIPSRFSFVKGQLLETMLGIDPRLNDRTTARIHRCRPARPPIRRAAKIRQRRKGWKSRRWRSFSLR